MVVVLCPSQHLLAEQAAQNPKLPAAAVDAIRLAAGMVVADIDEHQLQHAHTRHNIPAERYWAQVMVLFTYNALAFTSRSLLHVCWAV